MWIVKKTAASGNNRDRRRRYYMHTMTLLRLYDKTAVISLSLSTARALRVDFAGRLTPTDLSNSSLIFFLVVLLFWRFESVEPEKNFVFVFLSFACLISSCRTWVVNHPRPAAHWWRHQHRLSLKKKGEDTHTVCTLMLSHLARHD